MFFGIRIDTQFYWKLSPHIFRYGHGNAAAGLGPDEILDKIHTVDECACPHCSWAEFGPRC
jgi:Gly-Xaa carboxypeptidase